MNKDREKRSFVKTSDVSILKRVVVRSLRAQSQILFQELFNEHYLSNLTSPELTLPSLRNTTFSSEPTSLFPFDRTTVSC